MKWNTDEMIGLAQSVVNTIPNSEQFSVGVGGAGGDWDTDCVFASYFEEGKYCDGIRFSGFNETQDEQYGKNRSNVEAKYIELLSMRGQSGVDSEYEDVMVVGHRLKKVLKEKGWKVVNLMKDYC